MDRTWWQKQTAEAPLFPDLLWSRPENKRQAGKLLVVGGNALGFAAPAEAYAAAEKAGAGTVRVLLPDSLQKTVGQSFPAGEFAPRTPSGSFSRKALAELLEMAGWADAVVLAGDFGHNSETAVLLEKFAQDYGGPLALSQDALDYFVAGGEAISNRPHSLLATELSQLQKLAKNVGWPRAFTSGMDLLHMIDNLHDFTGRFAASVIVGHLDNTLVAASGRVSTTKIQAAGPVSVAAAAAVWWLQNPDKAFEAVTSSLIR